VERICAGVGGGITWYENFHDTILARHPGPPWSRAVDLFEYVGVMVSIVVGLALAHILTGVSRTIQALGKVRLYWVHSLWTLNIMAYLVAFWWVIYHWSGVEHWNFFLFAFLLLYAVALYLISALLFQPNCPQASTSKSISIELGLGCSGSSPWPMSWTSWRQPLREPWG
jgi:predicted Na+-dependent transporter